MRLAVLIVLLGIALIMVAMASPELTQASPRHTGGAPCSLCPTPDSHPSPGPTLPRDLLALTVESPGLPIPYILPVAWTGPAPREACPLPPDTPPRPAV